VQVWFQNRRQRERNQQRKVLHNSGDISDALLGFCSGDEDDEEEEDDDDDDGEEGDRSRADGDGSADMMLDLGDAADLVASDDEDALTRCMDDDNADGLIVGSALSAGGDGGVGAAATAVARSDGGGDAGAGAQMHTPNTSAHGGGVPHTPHAAVPSAPALDELLRPLLPSSKLGCGAAVAASASVNYSTHSMRAALAPSQLHEGAPAVPVSRPTLCARGGLSASTDVAVAAERAAAAYAAAAAFAAGAPSCAPLALDSFCTLGLSSRRTTLETASGATFDGARSGCGGRGACWPSGLSAVLSTTPASGPSGLAELLQPGLDERQLGERRPTADSYAALDSRRSTELGSRRPTEWSACAPPAAALCAAPTVVDGFGGGGIEAGVEAMPPPTLPSKPQGASSAYWYHYWRQVTEGIAQLQQWAAAADAATEGGGGGSLGLAAAACGVDADGVDTGSGSIAALQAAAARFHASLAQPQPAGGSVAAVGGTGGGGVCAAAGGGVGAFAAAGGGIGAYAATGGVQSESYLGLPHFGFCEGTCAASERRCAPRELESVRSGGDSCALRSLRVLCVYAFVILVCLPFVDIACALLPLCPACVRAGLPASMQLGFAAHLSRPQLQPLQPPRTVSARARTDRRGRARVTRRHRVPASRVNAPHACALPPNIGVASAAGRADVGGARGLLARARAAGARAAGAGAGAVAGVRRVGG
jgi:hypothetical protein